MSKKQEKSPQGDDVSIDPQSLIQSPSGEQEASQADGKDEGQGKATEDAFNPKEAYDGLRSLGDKRYNETKETLAAIVDKLDKIVQPRKSETPEDAARRSQEILNKFVEDPIGVISEISRQAVTNSREYKEMVLNSVEISASKKYKDFDTMRPYMEKALAGYSEDEVNQMISFPRFGDILYNEAISLRLKDLAKEGKITINEDKEQLRKGEDLNASAETISPPDLEPPITGSHTGRRIQDLF